MKNYQIALKLCACAMLLVATPVISQAQMSKVKTVWIILMENHNWTGNNSGAAFGAPDIKGSPLAPYINGPLLAISAHTEQYFNPREPSQPAELLVVGGRNELWRSSRYPARPAAAHYAQAPGETSRGCGNFLARLRRARLWQPGLRRMPSGFYVSRR